MDCCEAARPSDDERSPWTLRCDRNYERLFNIERRYIVVGADGGKARLLVKAPRSSPSSAFAATFIRNAALVTAAAADAGSADRRVPINGASSDDLDTRSEASSSSSSTSSTLSQCSSRCFDKDNCETFADDVKPRYSSSAKDLKAITASFNERSRRILVDAGSEAPPAGTAKSLRGSLSVVLSAIYFIFLVTVGVVIGVADLIVPETNIGEIFSICLLTPGLAWYVALHVDLLKHRRETSRLDTPTFKRPCRDSGSKDDANDDDDADGPSSPSGYTFHRGRHSGSFFLKIGAAGFCFGHLIHSCLMLGRQILHFTSPEPGIRQDCADVTSLILHLLLPVYSFYQLFILFKYSNVAINRWNELARFGLMHSMATSLFFWFWSVRNETVDSLQHGQLLRDHRDDAHADDRVPYLMNLTAPAPIGGHDSAGHDLMRMLWSGAMLSAAQCAGGGGGNGDFSALILHVSPYLYPFSIEYSISVGIWFIMWQNVGKVAGSLRAKRTTRADCCAGRPASSTTTTPTSNSNSNSSNHLVIHADCSSANRGLFAGMIVMVAVAVSIIVFFLAFSDRRYVATGIWIGLVSESTLLLLMIAATVLAYRQLATLDINPDPVSQLDDLLLFACIPSFFLYGIFSIVPAMIYRNYMALVVVILQVGQVILQTPLIINGLRRCSGSERQRTNKPGRELVTFLIVCNLSMWIMETLEIKSYETNRDRVHFYGHQLWTLLSHVTLPLTLFYRFHSASCLVDIWKSAYEPPSHDRDGGHDDHDDDDQHRI